MPAWLQRNMTILETCGMANIHPSAVVDPKAQIADDAEIGPLCVVGPHVTIGSKTRLLAQCNITGHTTLGAGNVVHPCCCLGGEPQDYGFTAGSETYLRIGDNNVFREGSTVHVGTKPGSETVVGNANFIMAGAHIGHNCRIGNQVILVNCAMMAGYVQIDDCCFISGVTLVKQFCRIGKFAMMWGLSAISKDLAPFMIVNGRNGDVVGVNVIALRRRNFAPATINALRQVHAIFFRSRRSAKTALDEVKEKVPLLPEVQDFITFVETSERGVLIGRDSRRKADSSDEE